MIAIVNAKNLKKVYTSAAESIVALKGINFSIADGEFVTIMGPSGAGKTTMLNLIGCLDNITDGSLQVLGKDLAGLKEKNLPEIRRKYIGFVFQEFFFIPTLTALENVMLPTVFIKAGQSNNGKENAIRLLEKVGLKHRLNHFPKELSGGELQRVAVARALINSPKIVLADEPTGNLDTKNSWNIFNLLKDVKEEDGVTVIAATHNVRLAQLADRTLQLDNGMLKKKRLK